MLAAGLALSPEKCKFGVTEVVYLGSVIRNGMISLSKQRVEDLQALPSPTTIKELRRVLGAFAFVQRWLPGVAEVARPLYDGVKGKPHSKLVWTKEMESAFVKLKSFVAEAVSLRIPDHTKKFTLITDCSDVGAGAVLTQEENGVLIPNAFFHHALTPAEQKYHTTDKELLAAVLAVRKFRVYLTRGFDLVTDHEAVKWLKRLNLNDEKGRRGRWVETLQQYDILLIHKPGRSPDLCMADYLSRIIKDGGKNILREERVPMIEKPQGGRETNSSVNVIQNVTGADQSETTLLCEVSLDEIRRQQREDKAMAVVVEAFIKSHESNVEAELDKDVANEIVHSKAVERLYLDKRGILMMKFNGGRRSSASSSGVKSRDRIMLPRCLTQKVLEVCHSSGMGGHMGRDRTWQRVRNAFYWKNMAQDVEVFVKNCEACARNKHSTHPNIAPFQETDLPTEPLKHLQFDFLGPFPAAQTHPFRYILQVQDVLSRFLLFFPSKDDTAETAAELLMNHWVCCFGTPETGSSDRGTHFTSAVFEALCKIMGIKHKLGAPKHPQSQGQCERQNQLMAQIRCICENNVEKWPEAAYRVAFAHNASSSKTTSIPPLRLILGQEPRTPEIAWLRDGMRQEGELDLTDGDFAQRVLQQKEKAIADMITRARQATRESQIQRMKAQRTYGRAYVVGDLVRIKLDAYEIKQRGKKLANKYSGKYIVTKVLGEGWTYELKPHGWRGRNKTRHFNDLKDAGRCIPIGGGDSTSEDENKASIHKKRNLKNKASLAPSEKKKADDVKQPTSTQTGTLEEMTVYPKDNATQATDPILGPRSRPKRNTRPPVRLQVGMEENKRYIDSCDSGTDNGNNDEEKDLEDSDGEWLSGVSSTGSTLA